MKEELVNEGVQKKENLFQWIKLISVTGGVQIVIQAVSFISGILVIRLLPTNEYALYTIANTMLGTISLLSDGGISTGVMAQGGKVWQDRDKLGTVLVTGLDLRKKFAAGSLLISLPILIYFLFHHGASWLTIVLVIASLIPAFYATMIDQLLEIVPKLHQSIIPLQKNLMVVGLSRLFLSALTLFLFPFTFVAIIAAGIPRIIGNIKLRKIAHEFANTHHKPDPVVRDKILGVVKRVLPGTIYFCISGQVTIWLISVFGKTSDVAQLGAIGRITIVLSIIGALMVTLVIPRFARLHNNDKLKSYFWKVHLALWILSISLVALIWFFSKYILMVLGDKYAGLSYEMTLSMFSGGIALIAGISLSLYTSRGWVINPIISISLSILALILGIIICEIDTLVGVIKLDIIVSVNQYLVHTGYCVYKIYRSKSE